MKSATLRDLCILFPVLLATACNDDNKGGPSVNPQPATPVAVVVASQTVNEGATVTLNGSASYDADNDIVSYQWTETTGSG